MFRNALVSLVATAAYFMSAGPLAAQQWPTYPADQLPWPRVRGVSGLVQVAGLLDPGSVLGARGRLGQSRQRGSGRQHRDAIEDLESDHGLFTFVVAFLLAISIPYFRGRIHAVADRLRRSPGHLHPDAQRSRDGGTAGHDARGISSAGSRLWRRGKKKKKVETLAAHEQGPPVQLSACGGSETENQAHLIMARQSPGYVFVKELVADSLTRRADRVMLDYTKEAVGVRYEIDGVWHNVEPRDRESGDVMLAVMKKISSLNMDERRARQEGEFKAKYGSAKYTCRAGQPGD